MKRYLVEFCGDVTVEADDEGIAESLASAMCQPDNCRVTWDEEIEESGK